MVSGLRYKVGADYENYVWIFHNLEDYKSGYGIEWGFYLLNKISFIFGLDEQVIFLLLHFLPWSMYSCWELTKSGLNQ